MTQILQEERGERERVSKRGTSGCIGLRKIDIFENLDELFNHPFQIFNFPQFIFAVRRETTLTNSADFWAEFCY